MFSACAFAWALVMIAGCGAGRTSKQTTAATLQSRPELRALPESVAAFTALDELQTFWPLEHDPLVHPVLVVRNATCDSQQAVSADVAAYVRAWCAIGAGDATSVDLLVGLVASSNHPIGVAAREDVAFLLAKDYEPAEAVERLRNSGAHDTKLFDTLAAMFAARGQWSAANAVVELADRYAISSDPDDQCERALNRIRIMSETSPNFSGLSNALRLLRASPADSECQKKTAAFLCQSALRRAAAAQRVLSPDDVRTRCAAYVGAREDTSSVMLLAAVLSWPKAFVVPETWLYVAELASQALNRKGALELLTAATENYSMSVKCDQLDANRVRSLIEKTAVIHIGEVYKNRLAQAHTLCAR